MTQGLKGIKSWMKRHDTAPELIAVLMRILHRTLANEVERLHTWHFDKERNALKLKKLIRGQQAICWTSIFKGRLCTMWKAIQGRHLAQYDEDDNIPKYKTAEWWTASLIQQLTYFSLNSTWQIRNEHLHQNRIAREETILRRELQDEMVVWYACAAKLGSAFEKYLRMPLLQRKTQAVKQLRSWIETVKAQYLYIEWLKNENGKILCPDWAQCGAG